MTSKAPTSAVLYARYSTAMQSKASIEDQFRLLRQRAGREGWAIVGEYADREISGSVRDRVGLIDCLAAIATGAATVLLAEALDRISRDQEDMAAIYKRIRFVGARIVTLSEGEVGALHVGMGGTMSALYIEQLAEKTRRGQIGRVEAGRIPGGLSYGYRIVRNIDPDGEFEHGLRAVDEQQAAIVRRIFQEYADGASSSAIVARLNREGVPGPRGGLWNQTTISGSRKRRNGILYNELYRGRILYNRQSFRKDPDTRKRIARVNDDAELVMGDVPDLRIVDEDLWNRVQERLSFYSTRPGPMARRPKRLLSCLMTCGECGGQYTIVRPDRWGCPNPKRTGMCGNVATISDQQAVARLWNAIAHHMLHPDVIAAYFEELRLTLAEHRRAAIAKRAATERRLAELDREDQRLADAIIAGVPVESLRARAEAMAAERADLRASMDVPALDDAIMHPAMVENYRRRAQSLRDLIDGDETMVAPARDLIVTLIEKIVVTPRANGDRGADLTLHGDLTRFLAPQQKTGPVEDEAGCMSMLVAGVGFGRWHTMRFAA